METMGRSLATWAAQSRINDTIALALPVESTPHLATVPRMRSDKMKAKKRPLRDQGEGKEKIHSGVRAEKGDVRAVELRDEQVMGAASRVPAATDPVRNTESRWRGDNRPRKQVSDQEHIACDAQPQRIACVAQPVENACVP
jgi:hypothetical protein